MVGMTVVAAVLAFAALYALRQQAREAEQQRAQQAMEVLWRAARSITTPLQAYYLAGLHRLSVDAHLVRLLEAADPRRLQAEAASLLKAFPAALQVHLLAKGWEDTDADISSLGDATLEMLRQAEASRLRPPVETHFPGVERHPQITLVQPVLDATGSLVGHVVLFLPWDVIQATWKGNDPKGGYLELQQGNRVVLASLGNPALKALPTPYHLAVEHTRWTLVYWSPPPPASPIPWLVLTVVVGLLLLGIGAFWLGHRKATEAEVMAASQVEPVDLFVQRMKRLQEQPLAKEKAVSARRAAGQPSSRLPVGNGPELGRQPQERLSDSETELLPAASSPRQQNKGQSDIGPWSIDIRQYDVPAQGPEASRPAQVPPVAGALSALKDVLGPESAGGPWLADPALEIDWEMNADRVIEPELEVAGKQPLPECRDAPWGPVPSSLPSVPVALFGPFDVNAMTDKPLTSEMAYHLGRAIGTEATDRGITQLAIGYDGRPHSRALAHAITGGLVSAGIRVTDIDRVPTPVLYFAAYHLAIRSGVMVTGSDDAKGPSEIRIVLDGEELVDKGLQALYQRVASGNLRQGDGGREALNILPEYLDRITSTLSLARPFKLVIDCGNGITGRVAPHLFRALGCEVTELFCELDGHFPHHPPDPCNPENLQALVRAVQERRADLGLAFDGDGDRLGVVDDQANIIRPDRQMMLYATDVLARKPGASIVFNVESSANLARIIDQHRGHAILAKAGAVSLRARMRETAALLAGDTHGHFLFRERWYGFSDALYAGARLLRILARVPGTASSVFAAFPTSITTPEIRIEMPEDEALALIEDLTKRAPALAKGRFAGANLSTVDGFRVDFNDRSVLLRAPEHLPCLAISFEALAAQALERIQAEVKGLLREFVPGIHLPF
jgi:phosphomannomutase